MRRTRIIGTIGPASDNEETLEALVNAGLNVARLNYSHGDLEQKTELINKLRKVESKFGRPVGILADLPGPKYRVGSIDNNSLELKVNEELSFECSDSSDSDNLIIWPPGIHNDVKVGAILLIDDGAVELEVIEIKNSLIRTKVNLSGKISSNKAVVARAA